MDLSAVAEEASNGNPLSVRQRAPVRDRLINLDKQLGDFANVESNVSSVITRPHWSSCSTYSTHKCTNMN